MITSATFRWRLDPAVGRRVSQLAPRFVAWSLVVSVLCAGAYVLVSPLEFFLVGQNPPSISEWLFDRIPRWAHGFLTNGLFFLAIISFLAAMTVALVAGLRALRSRLTRRGAGLTACGLLLAVVYWGGPTLWHARSLRAIDASRAETRARLAELGERLESGSLPEAQREKMWRFYATAMYRDEGVTVMVPDASGRRVAYEPSDADIAARRAYLELLNLRRMPTEHLEGLAMWVGLGLAIGLLTPLRRPREPAGPTAAAPSKSGTGALAEE